MKEKNKEIFDKIRDLSETGYAEFLDKTNILDDQLRSTFKFTDLWLELSMIHINKALIQCIKHIDKDHQGACLCGCYCNLCTAHKEYLSPQEVNRLEVKYPIDESIK